MKRLPKAPPELVRVAVHALIACRAGRPCLTHGQLATAIGCDVPAVRLALYQLHRFATVKAEQRALAGGMRTRMRVRLDDDRWTAWTGWSRLTPYSVTTRTLAARAAVVEAVA